MAMSSTIFDSFVKQHGCRDEWMEATVEQWMELREDRKMIHEHEKYVPEV